MDQTDPNKHETLPVTAAEIHDIVPLMDLGDRREARNKIATNFGGRGIQAAAFITQALAKNGLDLFEIGDKMFPTSYYLAHVAEFVDDNGEVIPMPRIVLIGPAGETLSFVSEGAIRSLDLIRNLCGDGPWNPPLPISVVPVQTRRKFVTYRLILGTPTDVPPTPSPQRKRREQAPQERDSDVQ